MTDNPTPSPAGGSDALEKQIRKLIAQARSHIIVVGGKPCWLYDEKELIDWNVAALPEYVASPSPPLAAVELETTSEERQALGDLCAIAPDHSSITTKLLRDFDKLLSALRTRDDVIEECARLADAAMNIERDTWGSHYPEIRATHESTCAAIARDIRSLKSGASRG